MSVIELTEERLASMNDKQRKQLVLIFPEYAQKVEAYEASRFQDVIDFSNQKSFTLADGSVVSLEVLEMLVYSSLGGRKADNDNSAHGAVKSNAWDIIHAVRDGKARQGITYSLTPEGFRNRVA